MKDKIEMLKRHQIENGIDIGGYEYKTLQGNLVACIYEDNICPSTFVYKVTNESICLVQEIYEI